MGCRDVVLAGRCQVGGDCVGDAGCGADVFAKDCGCLDGAGESCAEVPWESVGCVVVADLVGCDGAVDDVASLVDPLLVGMLGAVDRGFEAPTDGRY